MKKKSDIYKRNAEERLAKREDLLEKKRIRSRQSRAAANGIAGDAPLAHFLPSPPLPDFRPPQHNLKRRWWACYWAGLDAGGPSPATPNVTLTSNLVFLIL